MATTTRVENANSVCIPTVRRKLLGSLEMHVIHIIFICLLLTMLCVDLGYNFSAALVVTIFRVADMLTAESVKLFLTPTVLYCLRSLFAFVMSFLSFSPIHDMTELILLLLLGNVLLAMFAGRTGTLIIGFMYVSNAILSHILPVSLLRGMHRVAKVTEKQKTENLRGEADQLVGLKHSGHDHILAFSGSNPEEEHTSSGCLELISGPPYTCTDCRFFLHESCANLVTQIKTKFHTSHSLHLQPFSPTPTLPRICDVCGCNVQGFYYHCEICDFDAHPKCANAKNFPYAVRHPCHKHILHFYAREENPMAIHCSGCGYDSESMVFYICWSCKLYYHVRCTLLPLTISGKCYNGHALNVTFLPYNAVEQYFCDVCEMNRHPDEWVYYCGNCNYIVHLNCVT
ncbi:DC1 [Dillenia turbinata]|uniref:DC1 n=1 Tax=Dillenia turbinata TaxID=194707 RepID=A0AAN8VYJ5_9MAGN